MGNDGSLKMKDNQSMKKSSLILGSVFLALGAFLVIIEMIFGKTSQKTSTNTQETWEIIHHFIYSITGYKFIFPLLGLILIAFFAYMLHPLITKEEERP